MGVSIHYWAVPPSSGLFKRLQSDRAFVTLVGSLFPYGSGIFFFFDDIPAAEREEILQRVVDDGVLGPEPAARRLIEEYRQELERTRLAFPGIERRQCSLEKTGLLVEARLGEALKHSRDAAAKFAASLVYGDQVHGALEGREANLATFLNDPASTCAPRG